MLNETSARAIVLSIMVICVTVISISVQHDETVLAQEAAKNGLQQCAIRVGTLRHKVVWQKDCNK